MIDMTPNTTMVFDTTDPPTLNASIPAGVHVCPSEIWSDSYSVRFTQDQLPVVWPHLHLYEMSFEERQTLHRALKASVRSVGVGKLL